MKEGPDAVTVCIWTVFLLLMSSFTTSEVVFTEKPGPGPVAVPVGGHIIFNCSVSPGHQILGWHVYIPDVNLEYFTDSTSNAQSLGLLGITVRQDDSLSSQLIVNASRENLLTYAECEARTGLDDTTQTSTRIDVQIYGPPESPTNISFRVKDDLLTVTWYSSTIPNVSLTFHLNLTNLRTFNSKEVKIYDTQKHQFTVMDVQACDEFELLVKAGNNAGVSNYTRIIGVLPVLPDVNTLQYLLSKNDRASVTLLITFMVPTPCPVHPVTRYTLEVILEDSGQNMTEQSTPSSSSPEVRFEMKVLMENAKYTYSITAFNAIGRITTASTSFLTTDVQGVSLCLVEGSTYSIQCGYIAGSDNSSGCSFVLVGLAESATVINGTIDASTTIKEDLPNRIDDGRILVYDEDNVLIMNKTLESQNIGPCTATTTESVTATTTTTKTSSWAYLTHVIGFYLCMTLVILIASFAITVCLTVHGCRCAKKRVKQGSTTVLTKRLHTVNDYESQKELHHQEVANPDPNGVTRVGEIQLTS